MFPIPDIRALRHRAAAKDTIHQCARRAVLVLALVALIAPLTATGDTGASGAQAHRCAEPPRQTQDDLAVTSLAADRRIGVETARARMRAQYRSDELAVRVQRVLGERYGGLWIDTADDDRLTVGVVQRPGMTDVTAKVRELAAVCGTGEVTDVVPVSFPMTALVSGIDWLGTEVARTNQGAPAALGAAVIPSQNAVVLRLPADGTLTGVQQALVQHARERLGAMLQLEITTANARPAFCDIQSDVCDPPLRAGVAPYLFQQKWCTLAFLARSRSDQKLYIMTAGHCVRDAFVGIDYRTVTWQTRQPRNNNNFHDIGKPHSSYFDSRGDAALITVNNPQGWAARAWAWSVQPRNPAERGLPDRRGRHTGTGETGPTNLPHRYDHQHGLRNGHRHLRRRAIRGRQQSTLSIHTDIDAAKQRVHTAG